MSVRFYEARRLGNGKGCVLESDTGFWEHGGEQLPWPLALEYACLLNAWHEAKPELRLAEKRWERSLPPEIPRDDPRRLLHAIDRIVVDELPEDQLVAFEFAVKRG